MSTDHVADHLLVECAKWHGGVRGLGIVTTGGFDPREHFSAQVEAFAAVGLLDPDEAAAWSRRFDEAVPPARLEPDAALRERAEAYLESLRGSEAYWTALDVLVDIGVLTLSDATARLADEDEDEDEDAWVDVLEDGLRRVVLGPAEEAGGVRVIAVELYPRGLILRWTARDLPEIGVSDDLGTTYEEQDADGDEPVGSRVRGATTFTPGVPDGATRLAVDVPGGRLEVKL